MRAISALHSSTLPRVFSPYQPPVASTHVSQPTLALFVLQLYIHHTPYFTKLPQFLKSSLSMETNVYSLCELPHFSPLSGLRDSAKPNASAKLYQFTKTGLIKTQWPSLKLGFRFSSSRVLASNSVTNSVRSVRPIYVPTPPNRELRTPHSGYHFDGTTRRFFEGWYFKVSIPERKESFCFMYSVENPAFRKKLTDLEIVQHGPRSTGVGAQILGAEGKYICQYTEESHNFWGSRHELILGNTFVAGKGMQPSIKELPPQEFNGRVLEGFQVSPLWHQGLIRDDGSSNYVETVKTARWEFSTRPIYGWGNVGSTQKSTAGWLAAFPVFEPHWQICMAGGLSTGWIEWDGERFEFKDAPSYSEKNWGGAFPRKWFWVQCNVFEGATGEVALTAGGGLRQLPGLTENLENAALIGVHYDGIFYEFVPWNGVVNWEISPWGYWYMAAENEMHLVELETTTKDLGTTLRAPTAEAGLAPACKDTCFGVLKLQIWERRYDGSKGKVILKVTSDMAAAEVGGGPWFSTWKGKTSTPELLSRALKLPIDVDGVFSFVPFIKPPGL